MPRRTNGSDRDDESTANRRSILRKSGMAVATATSVVGLSGSAVAAGSTYGLGVYTEDGVENAGYRIEIPRVSTDPPTTVCGTDLTEESTNPIEEIEVQEDVYVIRGEVSDELRQFDPTQGDIWNIYDGGQPQYDESGDFVVSTAVSLRETQDCVIL